MGISKLGYKRIAVFGGSGATGREVVRHALRAGLEVVSVDQTLPDEAARVEGVSYHKADVLKGGITQAGTSFFTPAISFPHIRLR